MIDPIGTQRELIKGRYRSTPSLGETWQDNLGIDPTVWGTVLIGTGAIARDLTEAPYHKVALTGPAFNDTARLHTNIRWQCAPDTWAANMILKRLVMEWEAKFATVASIDNAYFLMGLGTSLIATRASNDIVAFILDGSDVLNSITKDGAAETAKTVGGPVLTNWHRYMIDVQANGVITFRIDGTLVATHTTADAEDLPDVLQYGTFYLPQEAAASGGELHIGVVRMWHEDIER